MNCLIVDDDQITREFISEYVRRTEFLAGIKTCSNAIEAVNILEKEDIDLLFLDIEMPEMSGLELLKTLSNPVPTILITSRKDYALESYEYGVIDYLVKPVDYGRFFKAVKKAHELQERATVPRLPEDFVFVKVNNQLIKIKLDDILFVEALADYVLIHTIDNQHIVLMTMKTISQRLPENFVRIHRSYIVNCNKIDSIEDSSVLINKRHLTISNTYKNDFLNHLKML